MFVILHICCAFFSLALLLIRGVMQLTGKDWRAVKILKIFPHISDTLLILTGAFLLYFWQFDLPLWLIGKFIALILYVVFSTKFFSRKAVKSQPIFFVLASLSFAVALVLGYFH